MEPNYYNRDYKVLLYLQRESNEILAEL
jgi:hypothetical protein